MKHITSPRWHFSSDQVRRELKDDPLALLAGAEEVKSNAVRQVFRNGAYYIKLDRRAGKSFSGEFRAARLCEAEKIPAVEHLVWGHTSEGSWLITRAADGFCEAAALFRCRQEWGAYESAALFLKQILSSQVYHPDLHLGNVLIDTASFRCRLVDLHGMRKKTLWDFFKVYMMQRCIVEFRNALSDGEMLRLIEMCGIRNPEGFFRKALAREAGFLRALTPKRRRQILSGYFKYARQTADGRLIDVESDSSSLDGSEAVVTPDASELFLFHFFLTQAKIPHRRILALESESNTLFLEPELPEKYRSAASAAELCRRLKYNGISSSEEDFKSGYLDNVIGVFRSNC